MNDQQITEATIGGMDLSNLTEDQLSVIRQLVFAAECWFDKLVESDSCSALQEKRLTKKANQCMTLGNRVHQELKNKDAANAHTVELDKANKVFDDFHRALRELGYEHAGDMVIDYVRDYAEELGLPEGVQS